MIARFKASYPAKDAVETVNLQPSGWPGAIPGLATISLLALGTTFAGMAGQGRGCPPPERALEKVLRGAYFVFPEHGA